MHLRVVGGKSEKAEQVVTDLLTKSRALLEGHFQLSSGLHSPNYVQCARLLEKPEYAEIAGKLLGGLLGKIGADVVVGPALGGVIIAHEVGRAMGARVFFAERQDGKMTLRRGFEFRPGETVLVVEDVITTGKSSLEVRDVIEEPDVVHVSGYGCIVNRLGRDELGDKPVRGLVNLEAVTYEPGSCPLCSAGVPLEKPGSRTPGQGPAAE